jgi:hypothetical protein
MLVWLSFGAGVASVHSVTERGAKCNDMSFSFIHTFIRYSVDPYKVKPLDAEHVI